MNTKRFFAGLILLSVLLSACGPEGPEPAALVIEQSKTMTLTFDNTAVEISTASAITSTYVSTIDQLNDYADYINGVVSASQAIPFTEYVSVQFPETGGLGWVEINKVTYDQMAEQEVLWYAFTTPQLTFSQPLFQKGPGGTITPMSISRSFNWENAKSLFPQD